MKLLAPTVAARITDAFRAGTEDVDVEGLTAEEGRALDVEGLGQLLTRAQELFADERTAADAWLAPRLHALLRLTRREAASHDLWLHLAVVDHPDYVRWRHGRTTAAKASRFIGGDAIQAYSRLWWAAELFRAGPDYPPVPGAFTPPDIVNTIMRLKAAHNRPFCIAFLQFVAQRRADGKRLIGRQVNYMSSAVNSQLFVASLDAVAPDIGAEPEAAAAWRADGIGSAELIYGTPVGPDDQADSEFASKVSAVRALLDRFADGAEIATATDPNAGSDRPCDRTEEDDDESESPEGAGTVAHPPDSGGQHTPPEEYNAPVAAVSVAIS